MRDLDLCATKIEGSSGFYSSFHRACPYFDFSYPLSRISSGDSDIIEWNNEKGWSVEDPTQLLLPRELL